MSAQDVTLAFVVGVLIRFGIPIGLTLRPFGSSAARSTLEG
jgi:hypothetical protein